MGPNTSTNARIKPSQPVQELFDTTHNIGPPFWPLPFFFIPSLPKNPIRRPRREEEEEEERERESLMGSLVESFQKSKLLPRRPYGDDLPISRSPAGKEGGGAAAHLIGMRKRISSFSVNIQPMTSASTEWAFRKSQSMPSLGAAFAGGLPQWRRWWGQGWGWLLSRKPVFAQDLEMNEEETTTLGWQSKGSWGHVFYRLRSEIRKLMQSSSSSSTSLPTKQEFRYDSFSYAHDNTPTPLLARG